MGAVVLRRKFRLAVLAMGAIVASVTCFASPIRNVAAEKRPGGTPVDIELVLAVDISYSMDPDEQALQRDGYVQALRSREFLQALRQGIHGKIAITYFEWAGPQTQNVVLPWRIIDGPEAADAVAAEIAATPIKRASRTSISGAVLFARQLFAASPYRGLRRVIDVSGDGANNAGALIVPTRDDAIADGIVINGLPIMLKRPSINTLDIEDLDIYYEDCVIGGPGSFVIAIREREKFIEATRTKMILEVAGREPEARIVPAKADKPRISCTIGEKLWQERWGGADFR